MSHPRRGLEAFNGPELSAYIERVHGGRLLAQRGSHITYELPDGRKVGSLLHGYIPTAMARHVAKTLGMTYPELRSALKRPIIKRTRRPHRPTRPARLDPPAVSRADVLRVLDALQADVAALNAVRYGKRDAAFYRTLIDALSDARDALKRLPRPLSTWEPPIETAQQIDHPHH